MALPITEPEPQRYAGDFHFPGAQSEIVSHIPEPTAQTNPGGPIYGPAYRILAVEAAVRVCDECRRDHHGKRFYLLKEPRYGLVLCPDCLDRMNPPGRITIPPQRYPELIKVLNEGTIEAGRPYNPDSY